jgi:DNA-binding XRE family transcriptional regulator
MTIKPDIRPELAEAARKKLGYTQVQMAEFLGMQRNTWQKKEQGENRVSVGEYHLFLLLTDKHPDWQLIRRIPDNPSPAQKAAASAIHLAQLLTEDVVLPSKVKSEFAELTEKIVAFHRDWSADIAVAVGDSLPPAPVEKTEVELLREKIASMQSEIDRLKKLAEPGKA